MAAHDVVAITKTRSMLIILLASCQQTLAVLDADHVLEDDFADDLRGVITRSESELERLNDQLRR